MGYVNGKYENDIHGMTIEVLEPTKDESNYCNGLQIQIEIACCSTSSLDEFRELAKWMLERADFIQNNFTKKGKPNTP